MATSLSIGWFIVTIIPRGISLLMISPTLTPIFFPSSPTVIVSPTFILLLTALGTVIAVFSIFTMAGFFASFHRDGLSSNSVSMRPVFFSTIFLTKAFFRAGGCSSISTSTGAFDFFRGFSSSSLLGFSTGNGRTLALEAANSVFAYGNIFASRGRCAGRGCAAAGSFPFSGGFSAGSPLIGGVTAAGFSASAVRAFRGNAGFATARSSATSIFSAGASWGAELIGRGT